MPRLRCLRIDTPDARDFLGWWNTFEFCESPYDSHFPHLTVLQLIHVDLSGFHLVPGLFPTVLHLTLAPVQGQVLNLIEACSGTVEELRVRMCIAQSQSQRPISLPHLKVLILDFPGIILWFDAPTLRLVYGNLSSLCRFTGPLNAVVEWATRHTADILPEPDITRFLSYMPQLQHLMICERVRILTECFEFLRDNQGICPNLKTIEVVERSHQFTIFKLEAHFKEYLEACVAWRAETVPGFTLQFVHRDVQIARLAEYFSTGVRSFTVMCHYLSYHGASLVLTRLRTP